MRIGIRLKLFLTLFTALCAVVLAMVLLMQWSFDRGFRRYVDTLEQERLARLADGLENDYAESGSWDFVRRAPESWQRLVLQSAVHGDIPPPGRMARRMARSEGRGEPPPPHSFDARVFLFDADRQPLAGHPGGEGGTLRELSLAGRTIGYLGLLPHRQLIDQRQLRFVAEQKRAFLLIGLCFAGMAALLSFPLARSLVRRIVLLAAGTHRLASGRFDTLIADDSGDELGQLARDFNALARTLAANETARRQWVADISHELRTPVAILRGEIEALRDGIRPATPEALASLQDETARLQRLIDDLHQLALADLGALSCRRESLDLTALLAEVGEDYRPLLARQRLELVLDLPPAAVVLRGDTQRLRQLCDNLLENALKYTDPPGRVELALALRGGKALLTLSDSAPGVPAEALPRLFDRLYRVESSRNRATGGSGLGLSICRAIVAAHNGTISAHPSPLGGVRIEVLLPLKEGR